MGTSDVGLEVMVRHIDYLIDKLGEDHVGLGSDFDGCTVPLDEFKKRRSHVMSFLNELSLASPNVHVWDPAKFVCDDGTCRTFRDGKPLFRDRHHFSYFGARSLGPEFVSFLEREVRRGEVADKPPAGSIGGR